MAQVVAGPTAKLVNFADGWTLNAPQPCQRGTPTNRTSYRRGTQREKNSAYVPRGKNCEFWSQRSTMPDARATAHVAAVRAHLEDRILVYGGKCVVFGE